MPSIANAWKSRKAVLSTDLLHEADLAYLTGEDEVSGRFVRYYCIH